MLTGEQLLLIAYGLLLVGAIVPLFADKLPRPSHTSAMLGSFCAGGAAVLFALTPPTIAFGDKFVFSTGARFASVGFCILLALWTMWVSGRVKGRTREAVSLAFFSIIGAGILVCSREFITFLVAFELTAMPSYILIGYWAKRRRGLEAALKYFLFSVMTTCVMSYGVSLLYASTGTTFIPSINLANAGPMGALGIMMLMVGMFTKVSAVPFHFWAPDAYAGAPAWTMAFVATVPKAGAMIAFIFVVSQLFAQSEALIPVLAVIASLSMIVGSFAALTQKSIRRIMAYSGVVNAGYTIVALLALDAIGNEALVAALIFTLFYAVAVMGILFIAATEGSKVSDLAGLSKRRPLAAWSLVILCLSLIGVPPLAGFFGKLNVFVAGLASPYLLVVLLATTCSVVSAFYYLRFVKAAFFDAEEREYAIAKGYKMERNLCANIALATVIALVCVLGPLVGILINWIGVV